jgi:1-acyl-sn-glycerol-3-phosphate acyltransferase
VSDQIAPQDRTAANAASAGAAECTIAARNECITADEARVCRLAEELARDLNPGRRPTRVELDSQLDRDLGIDSIGRAELIVRVEAEFGVTLSSRVLSEVDTPHDLLKAVSVARGTPIGPKKPAIRTVPIAGAAVAPADAITLCAALNWHADRHPDRPHIILEEGDAETTILSYRDLAERSRRAARGMREFDIAVGDRVAIMLPTCIDFFVTFFGALYAGAIPVPIYPPARASQIEEHLRRQAGILANAAAKMLVTSRELREEARFLRSLVDTLGEVATIADLPIESKETLPQTEDPGATALIQYTSGSTGVPKGVMLSHANILSNIRALGTAVAATSSDVFVSWLPVYHDLGLIGAWLGSLYYGMPFVAMPPQRFLARPERWLWAIHQHHGTLSAAPSFAFDLCVRTIEDASIAGLDLSSLRLVANGAEPVSVTTLRRFTEKFARCGFHAEAMAPAYGLAENTVGLTLPPCSRPPLIDRIARHTLSERGVAEPAATDELAALEIASCGAPLPGNEVRIVDDTGHELPDRREGRIQFRGPSATSGYFGEPAKTAALFDGDWLETGDLGYVAAGELYVTGRTKDIIIRGGRHLHPTEIEEAIGSLPGATSGGVAAFGIHDPHTGTERLVLLVETVLRGEQGDRLRALVASTAIGILDAPPEEIVFIPPRTLPKTASGKLRRGAARELYEMGQLGRRHTLRQQMIALGLAAMAPELRRARHAADALMYAAYWWIVIGVLAGFTWTLVMMLPRKAWRWAVVRAASRAAFGLTGARLIIKIQGKLPEGAVIVCNHASYVDAFALAAALPGELSFVAKRELIRKPLARWPLERLGTLFVERVELEQEILDIRHIAATARNTKRLVIFPEGGFTRAPGLMPFKLGAFSVAASAGLPIVPIALTGTRSILRDVEWFPRHGRVGVTIGHAIVPAENSLAEAARLRNLARAIILKVCGEPDLG